MVNTADLYSLAVALRQVGCSLASLGQRSWTIHAPIVARSSLTRWAPGPASLAQHPSGLSAVGSPPNALQDNRPSAPSSPATIQHDTASVRSHSDADRSQPPAPEPISPAAEPDIQRKTTPLLPRPTLQQSKVPSSRFGRVFEYGSLAASVSVGVAGEALKRAVGASQEKGSSVVLNSKNVERIVNSLSRMRGAALKLGQMLSIQDSTMIPPELEAILLRVQNSANYMPDSQLERVMRTEFGDEWRSQFQSFDNVPIAAASIGQVHHAVLPDGREVAVKIQYPGVADSIESDLNNLRMLIMFGNLLPKGMYLENTIKVARMELGWECDYRREAESVERFAEIIKSDRHLRSFFNVPRVIPELSSQHVITTEFVHGLPLGKVAEMSPEIRNEVSQKLLRLCLSELFTYRFMQTDPNWTNFLYDPNENKIHLLDFGAAREFPKSFTDKYMRLLTAAANGDFKGCVYWSEQLGFLTGLESETMQRAHVESILALAEPFRQDGAGLFDFDRQDITNRVRGQIPVMLRERLTPPPDETYSLHRKLSGFFLLSSKLRAKIDCKSVFAEFHRSYPFTD
ncbi:ABC1 family-domain-containing protein [Polychytrium aggregatum]|uniref:ABC1 family-domain-containing protein n=1 Tax=Polychytrium aggregatum TaxID=110093 RepID=UPI0022FF45C0|nr:ABC1 family-domain-containing protein [Polychytrium aggregatum]KAI9207211.1 ABC1 family-domain-containing protein [Polychytrium aggregatum]